MCRLNGAKTISSTPRDCNFLRYARPPDTCVRHRCVVPDIASTAMQAMMAIAEGLIPMLVGLTEIMPKVVDGLLIMPSERELGPARWSLPPSSNRL